MRLDVVPGHVLWFGEMHGTWEAPRFVGNVLSALDGPLQLGLEMPPAAITSLDDAWWTFHDGRSSEAMAELIEHARALGVVLVGYDADTNTDGNGDRDRAMAAAVLAARDANAIFVGLSGNIHSRKKPFEDITPCVMHLVDAGLAVTTYSLVATGGALWACMPECGLHTMPAGGDDDGAHDGIVMVGESTASYPARR